MSESNKLLCPTGGLVEARFGLSTPYRSPTPERASPTPSEDELPRRSPFRSLRLRRINRLEVCGGLLYVHAVSETSLTGVHCVARLELMENHLELWTHFMCMLRTDEHIEMIRNATQATDIPPNIRLLLDHFLFTADNLDSAGSLLTHSLQLKYDIMVATFFGCEYELHYFDTGNRERVRVFFDRIELHHEVPLNIGAWSEL